MTIIRWALFFVILAGTSTVVTLHLRKDIDVFSFEKWTKLQEIDYLSTLPAGLLSHTSIRAPVKSKKSNILRPHPHMGARDENGQLGYVPDPSPHHLKQSQGIQEKYAKACALTPKEAEGPGGNKVLQKIEPLPRQTTPRVLCMVYTISSNLENLQAIVDTWATDCDGFIAASNKTIPYLGSLDLTHMGPEAYNNMWQKVRSMWAFAYDNYRAQFDYFYM